MIFFFGFMLACTGCSAIVQDIRGNTVAAIVYGTHLVIALALIAAMLRLGGAL